jgi:hypothetical protein
MRTAILLSVVVLASCARQEPIRVPGVSSSGTSSACLSAAAGDTCAPAPAGTTGPAGPPGATGPAGPAGPDGRAPLCDPDALRCRGDALYRCTRLGFDELLVEDCATRAPTDCGGAGECTCVAAARIGAVCPRGAAACCFPAEPPCVFGSTAPVTASGSWDASTCSAAITRPPVCPRNDAPQSPATGLFRFTIRPAAACAEPMRLVVTARLVDTDEDLRAASLISVLLQTPNDTILADSIGSTTTGTFAVRFDGRRWSISIDGSLAPRDPDGAPWPVVVSAHGFSVP